MSIKAHSCLAFLKCNRFDLELDKPGIPTTLTGLENFKEVTCKECVKILRKMGITSENSLKKFIKKETKND